MYLGELSLNFWLGGELRLPAISPSAESVPVPPPPPASLSGFFLGLRLRTTPPSGRSVFVVDWEGESACNAFLAYLSLSSRVERGVGGIGEGDDDIAFQILIWDKFKKLLEVDERNKLRKQRMRDLD